MLVRSCTRSVDLWLESNYYDVKLCYDFGFHIELISGCISHLMELVAGVSWGIIVWWDGFGYQWHLMWFMFYDAISFMKGRIS